MRFFPLKSLTQVRSENFLQGSIIDCFCKFDLDLSVERGLWATQPHNEGVLDKAYRNNSDVFLIFGVNKNGEFNDLVCKVFSLAIICLGLADDLF